MKTARSDEPSANGRRHPAGRLILFTGLLTLSLIGCDYFCIARTYTVHLPLPPEAWRVAFGEMEQEIIWVDAAGELVTTRVAAGTRQLDIRAARQGICPVTANALPSQFAAVPAFGSALLLPAGAIIPFACDQQGSVVLSFRDGAAATVLQRLAGAGVSLSGINVSRLISEMPARTRGDPWLANLSQIVDGLGAGEFRADTIKPCEPVSVSLPEIGIEYPAYVVSSDPLTGTAQVMPGAPSTVAVAAEVPGLIRFYLPDGSLRLDLWSAADGRYSWLPVPARHR
ncbi:MAG TPA: hypothetical protein VMW87_03365 [Spirochaetia bacterium]|nr:hypothetical protein [Spirochaetia bacterium]